MNIFFIEYFHILAWTDWRIILYVYILYFFPLILKKTNAIFSKYYCIEKVIEIWSKLLNYKSILIGVYQCIIGGMMFYYNWEVMNLNILFLYICNLNYLVHYLHVTSCIYLYQSKYTLSIYNINYLQQRHGLQCKINI